MDGVAAAWREQRQQKDDSSPAEADDDVRSPNPHAPPAQPSLAAQRSTPLAGRSQAAVSAEERMRGLLFLLAAAELFPAGSVTASWLDDLDLTVRRWAAMENRLGGQLPPTQRSDGVAALSSLFERRAAQAGIGDAGEEERADAPWQLLGTVDAKLEALYSTDVDDEGSSAADRWRQRRRAPPRAKYASGLTDVLAALSLLPGWRDLTRALEPATLRAATGCAEETGMLAAAPMRRVLDEAAEILQLPAADKLGGGRWAPAEEAVPPLDAQFGSRSESKRLSVTPQPEPEPEPQQLGAERAFERSAAAERAAAVGGGLRLPGRNPPTGTRTLALPVDLQHLTVGLGWDCARKLDLDASVLLLRRDGAHPLGLAVGGIAYFSNPRVAGVAHQGDHVRGRQKRKGGLTPAYMRPPSLDGSRGQLGVEDEEEPEEEEDQEQVLLDLGAVAGDIAAIALVVNVYSINRSFSDVNEAYLRLSAGWPRASAGPRALPGPDPHPEQSPKELAYYGLDATGLANLSAGEAKTCNGLMLAALLRGDGESRGWELHALGHAARGRTAAERGFQAEVLSAVAGLM